MKQSKSALCVLLAGTLWGSMGLFVRKLNAVGLYALDIVQLRIAISLVLVGLYLLCGLGGLSGFGLGEVFSLLSALLLAGALIFGEHALDRVDPVTLTTLQTAASALMALLCALAFVGSIFGFKNVVSYVYPLCGYVGFFALIILLVGFGLLKRFWRVVQSRDLEYILLSAAALAVLPAVCNVMLLITSEATWRLQMAGALDLFIPLCILLLDVTRKEQPQNEKLRMAAIGGAVLLAGLIVYGNVYMRAVDQEAMYEGRKSLKTMTDRIADDLIDFG